MNVLKEKEIIMKLIGARHTTNLEGTLVLRQID